MCSYRDMFVDEVFDFEHIFEMNFLIDVKIYDNEKERQMQEKKQDK